MKKVTDNSQQCILEKPLRFYAGKNGVSSHWKMTKKRVLDFTIIFFSLFSQKSVPHIKAKTAEEIEQEVSRNSR